MKHRIMTHVACTGDGAKIHYEAMKWKKEMQRTQTRATSAINVLVRSALPVVKNCAAAQNYPANDIERYTKLRMTTLQ